MHRTVTQVAGSLSVETSLVWIREGELEVSIQFRPIEELCHAFRRDVILSITVVWVVTASALLVVSYGVF